MSFNNTSDWLDYDKNHLWHPYTSMTDPLPSYPVESAQGVRIKLTDGRELIDGMSSWWAAIHGYNHPVLNAAVKQQLQSMSHVMFGGLTHLPAVTLAKKLIDLTAEPLQHVFLADSGSVAVEVAIKMTIQYWYAQGKKDKQKLLTVRGGYHGDTLGGMSVCDPVNGMHTLFQGVLPKHFFAPQPECNENGSTNIESLEKQLQSHQSEIAAVIIEPIVQGAGGMRIYCPQYLQQLRLICDKYEVLLILDEIATGFARTGSLFAYEQADIVPDILCVGKALTGGYMTLAATMTTAKVVQGISADGAGILMHGPTFMANPLACQVANASIDLLLASSWKRIIKEIEAQLDNELSTCQEYPVVKEVRVKGAIGVVELHESVDMKRMQADFVEQGVWIRPFNKLVYIMPPYIINKSDLSQLTSSIHHVLKRLTLNAN
ncbi:MAG: adenosylmethionine--8-amino-7-oxononanoate transaminase [gamma proteobacterium symbiont of Bathyaustriella thionipta]|nr:adenosylmethionine--8-amino-7-oxononanoate transaminase [gamma proteobacterium symbiont of Bathyaustriella thionipta]MCU7948916.1 adenosylmethionine--8-amino-7-oxononanoate transaminase [gamma proteobacterium symbiont of Bathyaustriella thionipta]MCU7954305.1 adenosylmethionine--8-amino-7-oxononanoate transaminase [gamma proteobacterium symbiont of Bathyaustriella thionipta]MCU7955623.1 adenosylmethionine--8-amino-7-oxononanoate transaminase [gamma proteobacterium symbiont of Bathyaustriella 